MRSDRRRPAPKILAVEDSPSARKLFQGILLRLGIGLPDLRFSTTAQEALRVYSEWKPDIVFVDIELRDPPPTTSAEEVEVPHVDGDKLAMQLKERDPRLNLVAVTAFGKDHPRVKALMEKGIADVIVKPVLAARVQEILERFQAIPAPGSRRR